MLTYNDRLKIYKEEFSASDYGITGRELFKLISLVCVLTKAARKKSPDVTVIAILAKCGITSSEYNTFPERLSFNCEGMLYYKEAEFDTYGLTKATEMVEEIKRIVEQWLPF